MTTMLSIGPTLYNLYQLHHEHVSRSGTVSTVCYVICDIKNTARRRLHSTKVYRRLKQNNLFKMFAYHSCTEKFTNMADMRRIETLLSTIYVANAFST